MIRRSIYLLSGVLAGLIVAVIFGMSSEPLANARPAEILGAQTLEEKQNIAVYKETSGAVVFISTITLTIDPFDFFQELKQKKGSGSGFVVDGKRGIVITNLHVIQKAHDIEIYLFDGKKYSARLLGFDREYDIAVLKIDNAPADLPALEFADSSKLAVGQRVLAIGNPFGLNRTLTTGIISSLNRTVRNASGSLMKGLLQTDAAINPGNSGGPLLNSAGKLVGINTAILSQSGDSAGIGFAVPINPIKQVLPELIATGKVLRPEMGWVLVDTNQGPMVRRVLPDSPAAHAGVQPIERMVDSVFARGFVQDFDRADLVYKVNGQKVTKRGEVEEIISKAKPQDELKLVLRRGGAEGREREISVKPLLR